MGEVAQPYIGVETRVLGEKSAEVVASTRLMQKSVGIGTDSEEIAGGVVALGSVL